MGAQGKHGRTRRAERCAAGAIQVTWNIVLFAPEKGSYKKVVSGTIKDVESYLVQVRSKQVSKKKVLFLLTKSGLIAISTNLSIAIDQHPKIKDELNTHQIVLTPKILSPEDTSISKKCREFLGKVIKENPPKYANMTVGNEITDEMAKELDIIPVIDMWDAWYEFAQKGMDTTLVTEKKEEVPATGTEDIDAMFNCPTDQIF